MPVADVLVDAFDRVKGVVHQAVDGLSEDQLAERVNGRANSIAWLVWHLTRIQDDHIADVADAEQAWTANAFHTRFGLPFDESETGYGHSPEQVSRVRAPAELLLEYYDAVHEQTIAFVKGVTDADLPRVVDEGWDPPVTLEVRLVSVISDCLQHGGQAAFVRGLIS